MDVLDYFAGFTVADPRTGDPQRNTALQVYLPADADFTNPLTVTDRASGTVIDPFTSSAAASVPDFRVAGEPTHIVLKAGSLTWNVSSVVGAVMDAGLAPEVMEVVIEAALGSGSGNCSGASGWGFYPILSASAPTRTTIDGLPVLWLDPATYEAPIPVLPPAPEWDDADSKFTVPSGVVGVDYVWTSGGGGVGATAAPGATLGTSGGYPRTVTITPVAKPGYVLAAGVRAFVHDFPDPTAVTVMVSDGFVGASAASLTGRLPDNTLGGSLTSAWKTGDAWHIDGAGNAVTTGKTDIAMLPLTPGWKNIRAEVDVTSMSGSATVPFNLTLVDMEKPGGSVTLALDSTRAWLYVSNGKGGNTRITDSGDLVPGPGLWILQIYGTTCTVTDPAGHPRVYDLSDTSLYLPGSATANAKTVWLRNSDATSAFSVNSLKISKVGF